MEYTKECPECNETIVYNSKYILNRSIKNNSLCRRCSGIKRRRVTKEEKKTRIKNYYLKNKEKMKKYGREYLEKNKDKIKNREIEYRKRPEVKKRKKINNREYQRKINKNPIIKMKNSITGGIGRSLKSQNLSKNGRHWEDLVGYTIQELKGHLESLFTDGMNWDNYGKNGWVMDHIIPQSFFEYNSTDDVEFKYCWSLNNLQPLWEKDNFEKRDKMILWSKKIRARDTHL